MIDLFDCIGHIYIYIYMVIGHMAAHRPCFVVLSSSLSMSHITCPIGRSMTICEVKDLTQ